MEKYEVINAKKVNGLVEQVMFYPKKDSKYYGNVSPVFYVKEMEEMLRKKSVSSCLQWVTETYENAQKLSGLNFKEAIRRENITMRLVNTEKNQALLREVPHRQFHDLSVVYYVDMTELEGCASVGIKYSNLEKLFPDMTEEDLFRQALDNERTSEHNPLTCQSMLEVLLAEMGCPAEALEEMRIMEMAGCMPILYVLSKKRKSYGASVVLHEDMLKALSEKVGAPLWLIPSSVHEWIAVPMSGENPVTFMEMVHEVNMAEVLPEERLSNHVYRYDTETGVTMIPLEEGMDSDILCDCQSQAAC